MNDAGLGDLQSDIFERSDEDGVAGDGPLSVLFVDDERSVLDGLRRMLRSMRKEWCMRFADSGAEALAALEREPAHVVISDLRMPTMNGAELLEEVKCRWPRTIRLILSGDATRSQIFKTVGPAHQFLAKPCSPEDLKRAISQASSLRGALTSPALQGVVAQMESIPSLPGLYQDLQEVLQAEDVSLNRVADIIARDPGMTAKILKLVNSAFFGLRRTVSSPQQAVNILGLETIHALVLSTQAFDIFEVKGGLDAEELADHNARVGMLASSLAEAAGGDKDAIDAAFVAGLLHDIGRLILATNYDQQYRWMCEAACRHRIEIHRAEQRIFKADHGEVGGYLLGLWGLSDTIVSAVALHHRPSQMQGELSLPLLAVHCADVLDIQHHDHAAPPASLDRRAFELAGRGQEVDTWLQRSREILQHEDEASAP